MKKSYYFIKEFIKRPKDIGAVFPSSKFLSNKMISSINFNDENIVIIEYGGGLGAFTDKLIKKMNGNQKLYVIENNQEFFTFLKGKYSNNNNINIIYDSAENIIDIKKKLNISKIDYIVSGIPFTSIPKEISDNILINTKKIMNKNSIFITFQYSLVKLGLFKKYFNNIGKKREIRNFPPAFVLEMKK